jgi:hypothetical protein
MLSLGYSNNKRLLFSEFIQYILSMQIHLYILCISNFRSSFGENSIKFLPNMLKLTMSYHSACEMLIFFKQIFEKSLNMVVDSVLNTRFLSTDLWHRNQIWDNIIEKYKKLIYLTNWWVKLSYQMAKYLNKSVWVSTINLYFQEKWLWFWKIVNFNEIISLVLSVYFVR